jgi:hypothetical protein
VHKFGSTQNGVDGTGLYALGAADTLGFANHGDQGRLALTMARVKGLCQFLQQFTKTVNGLRPSRWALVDRFALNYGAGVRSAACESALTALGLR